MAQKIVIQTPRGAVVVSGQTSAELKWNPDFAPKWTRKYTAAQKFVDSEVLRRSDKYVPFLTGALRKSGILGTDVGSGEVAWIVPYARYQYYGKTKRGKPLHYHGGSAHVGAFWFHRMKAAEGAAIIAGARSMMRG